MPASRTKLISAAAVESTTDDGNATDDIVDTESSCIDSSCASHGVVFVDGLTTDLGVSCRGASPRISCLRSGVSARIGMDLNFADNHIEIEREVDESCNLQPTYRRVQSRRTGSQRYDMLKSNISYREAEAIAKASSLAGVCGYAATDGWAVDWRDGWCWIFHPPADTHPSAGG